MTITNGTRVAALAHHMAFFTVMAICTCDGDDSDQKVDMALDLWLDQHGYANKAENLALAIEAMEAAGPLVQTAIREAGGDVGKIGRLILQWAEKAGLSRLMFIQKPMH